MCGNNRGVLQGILVSQSVLLLFSVQAVLSQTIVETSFCSNLQDICGRPEGPNTEKYCCVETNGDQLFYKCCNPYIGLIVGMCVGVPVIILVIVGVILLYCICAHYQNKNVRRLTMTYNRPQTQRDGIDNLLTPPPYTRSSTSAKVVDSDLPSYSTADPYAASVTTTTPTQTAIEEHGDAGNQSSDAVVMEDIPLLSGDESRS